MFFKRVFTGLAGLSLVVSGAVAANDLAPRYSIMGEMTVELGGQTLQLVIPYDNETSTAYGEQKMIMGSFLTLNTVGVGVGENGAPGQPRVQVTLQRNGGAFSLLSAELFDDQGFDAPMIMGPDGGDGALREISFENNRLDAVVEGEFQRLTGYSKGSPTPVEGVAPAPVTIRWGVDLPALN